MNSRKPRLRFSQRRCRWVMIRTSVWPWELSLGTLQAQTHAKPSLCQPFEEQRTGERDHNEYLKKKKPPIHAALEKHRLPLWSVLFCRPSSVPFFPPCSKNFAEVCRLPRGHSQRATRRGARLLQNGFVTTSVAQTWPKTHSPLG